jgi:hypothetical protein
LIPGRNDFSILKTFVEFFDEKEFIITFGTEHNTPEMIPLNVTARGRNSLSESLKKISWRGASVIAAHQYLRSRNKPGYIGNNASPGSNEKKDFESLGQLVIEYFLNKRQYETGNFGTA